MWLAKNKYWRQLFNHSKRKIVITLFLTFSRALGWLYVLCWVLCGSLCFSYQTMRSPYMVLVFRHTIEQHSITQSKLSRSQKANKKTYQHRATFFMVYPPPPRTSIGRLKVFTNWTHSLENRKDEKKKEKKKVWIQLMTKDSLFLPTELIMWPGHCKEFLKLVFWASALLSPYWLELIS